MTGAGTPFRDPRITPARFLLTLCEAESYWRSAPGRPLQMECATHQAKTQCSVTGSSKWTEQDSETIMLIGTIRRESLDHTLFWTTADLETKPRFPTLLPRASDTYRAGPAETGIEHRSGRRSRECQFVWMAAALSWVVSHAGGVTHGLGHSRNVRRGGVSNATRVLTPT